MWPINTLRAAAGARNTEEPSTQIANEANTNQPQPLPGIAEPTPANH